ncbi:hypothetical protein OOK29_26020 [Streptomyces phaeochromogenes]|uniref:hypothetical protein n=1 Tax=Streptomyces phaeochromogenes TaxID=1923 RepID=UPI00224D23D7|nr:hypothetical protein [Streptomyces phaeochromogenes]MCX5601612.1 hypothetical protein [Streptomyces phaeochromogenes]
MIDGLGVEARIAEGELVAGAIVLLKVLDAEGSTRLTLASSDGLGWIERVGMLRVAEATETSSLAAPADD